MEDQVKVIIKKVKTLTPLELENIKVNLIECFKSDHKFPSIVYKNPYLDKCLLLYIDNNLVGHIGINKRVINHKNKTYIIGGIGDVAINKKYRKKGLGNKLMKEANKSLNKDGYNIGILFCHPKLDNFYSSCGWIPKDNGKIFATVDGVLEDQRRTFLLPIKLTKKELEIWMDEDINIGNGSW